MIPVALCPTSPAPPGYLVRLSPGRDDITGARSLHCEFSMLRRCGFYTNFVKSGFFAAVNGNIAQRVTLADVPCNLSANRRDLIKVVGQKTFTAAHLRDMLKNFRVTVSIVGGDNTYGVNGRAGYFHEPYHP